MTKKRLPFGQERPAKRNPCHSAPKAPAGVAVTFKAVEARTHLRFSGQVRWDEVDEDLDGFPISPDRYEVVMVACDEQGNPVDKDGQDNPRYHARLKAPLQRVRIIDASTQGTIATFTTSRPTGWGPFDRVRVEDVEPNAYNGVWDIIDAPTNTTFRADIGASPGPLSQAGRATDRDEDLHVLFPSIPRPKTWYWKARVRARNREGCWGPWSPWTTPVLPWSGANPKPPTPTGVGLSFDRNPRSRRERLRAVVQWNEIRDFDYPGQPADPEEDVSRYAVQLQHSEDGVTPDGRTRTKTVEARSGDDDTTQHVVFRNITRRLYYRARVRAIDRFNRRGEWSAWTAWTQPSAGTVPQPTNVTIFGRGVDRVVLDWDAPYDADDSELLDWEIAHFQVQLSKSSSFSTIRKFDRHVTATRASFKLPAAEEGDTFYGRVRAVNEDGDKSAWVPATKDGNSDPNATAEGVRVVQPRVVHTFSLLGSAEVKVYKPPDRAEDDEEIIKVTGDFDDPPTGSDLVIDILVGGTSIFGGDTSKMLRIQAGGSGSGSTTQIVNPNVDANQRIKVEVKQVGSGQPGGNGTIRVVAVRR